MNDICHDNPPPSITDLIRQLNDRLRIHGLGGRIILTSGVLGLDPEKQAAIANAIRTFTDFNEDNDPHGEHDLAVLTVDETEIMFKIDYFDKSLRWPDFTPPAAGLFRRYRGLILHRRSHLRYYILGKTAVSINKNSILIFSYVSSMGSCLD